MFACLRPTHQAPEKSKRKENNLKKKTVAEFQYKWKFNDFTLNCVRSLSNHLNYLHFSSLFRLVEIELNQSAVVEWGKSTTKLFEIELHPIAVDET